MQDSGYGSADGYGPADGYESTDGYGKEVLILQIGEVFFYLEIAPPAEMSYSLACKKKQRRKIRWIK